MGLVGVDLVEVVVVLRVDDDLRVLELGLEEVRLLFQEVELGLVLGLGGAGVTS